MFYVPCIRTVTLQSPKLECDMIQGDDFDFCMLSGRVTEPHDFPAAIRWFGVSLKPSVMEFRHVYISPHDSPPTVLGPV